MSATLAQTAPAYVALAAAYKLPDGVGVAELHYPVADGFAAVQAAPDALIVGGRLHTRSGFSSDAGRIYYRTDALAGRVVHLED